MAKPPPTTATVNHIAVFQETTIRALGTTRSDGLL